MDGELMGRQAVDKKLTWDLASIFRDEQAFNEALSKVESMTEKIVRDYHNNLKTPDDITDCLDRMRELRMIFGWISTYSSLSASVDQKDQTALERDLKVEALIARTSSKLSFIDSALALTPDSKLAEAARQRDENKGYLEEVIRKKPHMLNPETEMAISALSGTLDAAERIYNTGKLADMNFDPFEAGGENYPLSFLSFEGRWEYEKNTEKRRAAFEAFSRKLAEYQHTFAAAYQTQVSKERTLSELRGFNSVFDYLLHDQRVDRALYDRQIDLVVQHLAPHMRRYAKLLKKVHGLDKMKFSDLKIEIDPEYQPDTTIEEAKTQLLKALGILGEDYSSMLERAFEDRWIDFPENDGKSTGAFCSTPYGTHS